MSGRQANLFCLWLGSALFWSALPVSADVEVRFFDEGNLIVGAHVAVLMENPTPTAEKLAPSADGTYIIGADVGSKITLHVESATTEYMPVTVSVLADVMDVDVVARQVNDVCLFAEGPLPVPSVTPGSTIGATDDPEAPYCGTSVTGPGVWYKVIGTGNTMTASTCNDGNPTTGSADYDSKLNVYCLGCDFLICVAGNDDGPGCLDFSSQVSWCSFVGAEYLILVQGFFGAIGNFELAVYDNGVQCTDAVDCSEAPGFGIGACCNCLPAPFNCTEGTLGECLALDGDFLGFFSTCVSIDNQSTPYLEIPDGAGVFVCDTITVAKSLIINDVNVQMTFTHTWIGDLEITLEHNATLLTLWQRQCGSIDNINSTADDEYNTIDCAEIAAGPVLDVRWPPAIAGLGPLSVYDGMDAAGPWTMCAADFVGLDSGTLDSWVLQFNDEIFPTICDVIEDVEVCFCDGDSGSDSDSCDDDSSDCRTIVISADAVDDFLAANPCSYLGPCVEDIDDDAERVETVRRSSSRAIPRATLREWNELDL